MRKGSLMLGGANSASTRPQQPQPHEVVDNSGSKKQPIPADTTDNDINQV
jgi:hypothetical protein